MALYFKKSSDAGAPALTNTAGSLIAVLDYCLVTTMGFTKTVLGTNVAKYAWPAGTNGFSLQVKDTATASSQLSGWETLTSTDTGTGKFPTVAQQPNEIYIDKAAATSWRFISNGKMFYLFVRISASQTSAFVFGDFDSYKAADLFGSCIVGNVTAGVVLPSLLALSNSTATSLAGHFICRSYTQVGTSIIAGKFSDNVRGGAVCGLFGANYPGSIDGALRLAPIWISETGAGVQDRGLLPGVWNVLHNRPLSDADTFSISSGALAGRSFEIVDFGVSYGQVAIETSNTWGGF